MVLLGKQAKLEVYVGQLRFETIIGYIIASREFIASSVRKAFTKRAFDERLG